MDTPLTTGVPHSFENVILWFTIYYLTERGLRHLLRSNDPTLYQALRSKRKDLTYLGLTMSLLITLLSSPVCFHAAYTSPALWQPGPSIPSTSATICIVSRGVGWVSELNTLGEINFYLFHHLGSLLALVTMVAVRIPLETLYIIYATLLFQGAANLVYLAGIHGYTRENSVWYRRLELVNACQYIAARGPGIIFGFYFIRIGGSAPGIITKKVVGALFLCIYGVFNARCFAKSMAKIGWFEESTVGLHAGGRYLTADNVSMGMGLLTVMAGGLVVFADMDVVSFFYPIHRLLLTLPIFVRHYR